MRVCAQLVGASSEGRAPIFTLTPRPGIGLASTLFPAGKTTARRASFCWSLGMVLSRAYEKCPHRGSAGFLVTLPDESLEVSTRRTFVSTARTITKRIGDDWGMVVLPQPKASKYWLRPRSAWKRLAVDAEGAKATGLHECTRSQPDLGNIG